MRLPARAMARAAAAVALTATTATVGASAAVADPWLTWAVLTGVDDEGRTEGTLYAADAVVGVRAALAPRSAAVAADFSEDGAVAAYIEQEILPGQDDHSYRVALVRRDGTRTTVPVTDVAGRPDLSADGTTVTFGRTDGSVQRYDPATAVVTTLCQHCTGLPKRHDPEISNVALSPDGQYVAVAAFGHGDAQALVIHRIADGARVARLTFGEGQPDDTMAWTPESTAVAHVGLGYVDERPVWQVGLLGLDGTRTPTAISAKASTPLSGPIRLGSTWYVVRTRAGVPAQAKATVLRTDALSTVPTVTGTVGTRGRPGAVVPYVGLWAMSTGSPAPYVG